MRIREAKPIEADELTKIAFAAKQYWGYSEQSMKSWARTLTISERAIKSNPTFVAEEGGIQGFCMLWSDGRSWELEHMWVSPQHMRRGIGKALIAHAVEFIRARGGDRLRIDADPNAEVFYKSCGAVRTGSVAAPIVGEPDRERPILSLSISGAP